MRDGMAEPVSRVQFSGANGTEKSGKFEFPCSADHAQDLVPYPVDSQSFMCDDHTYMPWYITCKTFPQQLMYCASFATVGDSRKCSMLI